MQTESVDVIKSRLQFFNITLHLHAPINIKYTQPVHDNTGHFKTLSSRRDYNFTYQVPSKALLAQPEYRLSSLTLEEGTDRLSRNVGN